MRVSRMVWGVLLFVLVSVAGADALVDVYVDGKKQDFAPGARVREGKAYAPLRAAAEAVGADVKWIEARQMAVVCKEDRCINIKKAEGIIVEGRLLIPLRLMAEALQAQVSWDGERKAVLIRTDVPQATTPLPREILDRMLAAYKGAETYQAEGQYVTKTTFAMDESMEMQIKVTMTFNTIHQTPNLLYAEYGPGRLGSKYVCDGQYLYLTMNMADRAVKAPAPEHLRAVSAAAWRSLLMFGELPEWVGMFDLATLVRGEFDTSKIECVDGGVDWRNKWLSSLRRPKSTWVITVALADGPRMVMWIDRRSYLLRQIAAEMTGQQMMPDFAEELPEEEEDEFAQSLSEAFQGIKMQILISYQKTILNEPVPEGTFVYEPPEHLEVTEVESVEEMFSAVMGGMTCGIGGEGPEGKDLAEQAPVDFTAQDLEGNSVKLSDFKGQPLVLDFWATWCPPCVRALPILEEIYAQLKSQGLQIVAVSSDARIGEVKKYVEKHPVSFTVLWLDPRSEESSRVDEEYVITAIPRTLYISSDWVVKADTTGLHHKKDILEAISGLGIDTRGVK